MQKITTIIFDLDGTLLDTIADIAACANHTLSQLNQPTHPINDYNQLAGQGIRYLFENALAPDQQYLVDKAIKIQAPYQLIHGTDQTKPFPGILDLLHSLQKTHKLAVLSNKPHTATITAVADQLPQISFTTVQGQSETIPPKPDPTGAHHVCQKLNISPAEVAYLGDTAADMQTAVNAGFLPIGVTWGFRSEKELLDTGAKHIIHHPSELFNLI